MEISLHIIYVYESLDILHFLSRSERNYCFNQHKICYSSIHKDIIALNKIRKDIIISIFIVETIEEEEK